MTRTFVVLQLVACSAAPPSGENARPLFVSGLQFDPPDTPAHDDEETNNHARGSGDPFLCAGGNVDCSQLPGDGRPADDVLSCDAAGCHGDTEYVTPDEDRHLLGSDGPSCHTCHDEEEWE